MFTRRFAPVYPEMFGFPYRQAHRPRSLTVMPEDLFAILDPWNFPAEKSRCGKMCRNGKFNGKPKPKNTDQLPMKRAQMKRHVTEEPWETTIKAEGFKPNDFMMFLNGRTLVIHGEHSEGDEDSGIIKKEFRRKVTIPNDVILPTLSVDFKDGNIVLSGRKRVVKTEPATQDLKSVAEKELREKLPENTEVNKEATDVMPTNDVPKTNESTDHEMEMVPSESKCEDSSKCTDCKCQKSCTATETESTEDVMMEHFRPEETDGVPVSPKVDTPKDNVEKGNKVKEVEHQNTGVTEENQTTSATNEVVKKDEKSEVVKHKPITWSIPLDDFNANDVRVRLEDDVVRVTAEREEEQDGMTFFRRMERSFRMPKDVDPDTLSSQFCMDDSKLILKAMPKQTTQKPNEEFEVQVPANPTKSDTLRINENGWTILPINFD